MKKSAWFLLILLTLSLFGLFDSGYLTYEHFNPSTQVFCKFGFFSDCGWVLKSKYSIVYGVPLAMLGVGYYATIFLAIIHIIKTAKNFGKYLVLILSTFGFLISIYLSYLQLFVIRAICLYCVVSALVSFSLFVLAQLLFFQQRKKLSVSLSHQLYLNLIKPILFLTKADAIHEGVTDFGQRLGQFKFILPVFSWLFEYKDSVLQQKILGIEFGNPVGLAAGFDYEAKLTQILPSIGFGFQTVGTVTNTPYEGNPLPRLGRLPKSRSLLVNKGFKSSGAKNIVSKLKQLSFAFPVGVSIGRTNSALLKTQKQSIDDIVSAFKIFEQSRLEHRYYELNISCPNLFGKITFYPPKNLEELLEIVDQLKLKKPVFVKMPITKSKQKTLAMLKIIAKHCPAGIIFGNLETNRKNKVFDKEEIKKAGKGNFSGLPTQKHSNELITLTYKKFKKRFIIVGCGGIFSGADAYEKIKRGANLVQFITGLIYEGPQLAAQINLELADLLKRDGYQNISEAVGVKVK